MSDLSKKYEWNGIDLEDLRQVMDPPADKAVASIFESKSMRHLATELKKMAENDGPASDDMPEDLKDFLNEEQNKDFSDEDIAMFNRTHEIWVEHGTQFIFILFFRALPYTYMAEKPANVLRITKLLEEHADRRIFETAQFVFDVMEDKWWEPKQRGILTALKVRIMHSAMRHIILDSDDWNEEWGKPISQEDLIATNQVFSLEFFKGLEMLGVHLSNEDKEAWFHTWKTIGRIMGVQDRLLAPTVDEAWELQHAVYEHLFKDETYSGIALASALVKTMKKFHMPEKLALYLMKHMLADEQFPDCFHRMLGPNYEEKYPELFLKLDDADQHANHEHSLNKDFHSHAKDYYKTIQECQHEIEGKHRIFDFAKKALNVVFKLIGMSPKKISMLDHNLGLIHHLFHDVKSGEPLEHYGEDFIKEIMTHFSGIIVTVLSGEFRDGKKSGFRIPQNLKENWGLKG